MSYTDKEIIDSINEQIQHDAECVQQIHETIAFKKELWVRQELQKILVDHGLTISDAEFEQIVQEALNFMDEQETQGNIVFNEIQL